MRKAIVISAIVGILLVSAAAFAYGGRGNLQTTSPSTGRGAYSQSYGQAGRSMVAQPGKGYNNQSGVLSNMPMGRSTNNQQAYNRQGTFGKGGMQSDSGERLYVNREDSHYFAGEDIELIGVVIEVVQDASTELKVETTDGTLYGVETGPLWLYDEISFDEGDEISINGKLVTEDGETFVVPASITVDGTTVQLRDENGTPEWAGSKNRFSIPNTPRSRGNFKNDRLPNCN